jgi:transcriptional regulator with XRE-family HTH domain
MGNSFGHTLKKLRLKRGLTLRKLEQISGIANSNLALLESGRKPCGPVTAERLAQALKLAGEEYVEFCLRAITTTKSRKRMRHAEHFDPKLWAWLVGELRAQGIKPSAIANVIWKSSGTPHIVLDDRRVFYLTLTVRARKQLQLL